MLRLHPGEQDFTATVRGGSFNVKTGEPENAGATFSCEPAALQALVFGGRPLDDAIQAARVRIEGDREVVERFIALFPLPVPVPSGA